MQRRRGWTLIELIAVMFGGTAVLLVAVSLAHAMFDLQKAGQTQWRDRAALAQLADQFREDAHAAAAGASTAGPGKPSAWEWPLEGDLRVRYLAEDDRLTRTALQQDRVVARETFRLPATTTASIEIPADKAGAIASLVIRKSSAVADVASPPVPPVRIDAAWGLDRRIAGGAASAGSGGK